MPHTLKTFALVCGMFLCVMLAAVGAYAQTSVGTVEGTVADQQGAVLPGATATLTGPRGSQTVTTDEKGFYRFVGVQPGSYTLKVELGSSFASQSREIKVDLGATATIDFTLKVASLSENVLVTAQSPPVDVRSTAVSNSVSQNMLQMTPLYSPTSTGLCSVDDRYTARTMAIAVSPSRRLTPGARPPSRASATSWYWRRWPRTKLSGGLGAPRSSAAGTTPVWYAGCANSRLVPPPEPYR